MIKKVVAFSFVLSLFVTCNLYAVALNMSELATPGAGNGSFEVAGGQAGSNWDTIGEGYRWLEGDTGAPNPAKDGDYMLKCDKNDGAGNMGGAISTQFFNYTPGDTITYTGWYNITTALPDSSYSTFLKIQYYSAESDGSKLAEEDQDTGFYEATSGWTQRDFPAKSDDSNAHYVKFIVTTYGAGTTGYQNRVYWDNMSASAVPEPSVMFLFGSGLLGLLGAGWRRFRAAKQ